MGIFAPIKVTGLKELQGRLKAIDAGAGPALRKVLNASADLIVTETPKWVPKQTGRAAGSIRASSTQNKARVTEGGSRARWMAWLDFGGKRPGRGGRPYRKHGRYIYYTLGKRRDDITKGLEAGLAELVKAAGLEVTNG